MGKESKKINLVLGLSPGEPDVEVKFRAMAMRSYPEDMQNMTAEYLMSDDQEAQRKLAYLTNIRAEVNFWCRDNCKRWYRIEDRFEPQGMRVYFETMDDCVEFEKHQDTVQPCPDIPEDFY